MAATVAKTVLAKTQFTVVCAWCDQVLNDKPKSLNLPQTHTICPNCMVKMREEIKTFKSERASSFLNLSL